MKETTYYQRNKEVVLNRANDYKKLEREINRKCKKYV